MAGRYSGETSLNEDLQAPSVQAEGTQSVGQGGQHLSGHWDLWERVTGEHWNRTVRRYMYIVYSVHVLHTCTVHVFF